MQDQKKTAILTEEQAKLEWYKLNPRNQTDLNYNGNTDPMLMAKRTCAFAHLKGFEAGLQFCGRLEVR